MKIVATTWYFEVLLDWESGTLEALAMDSLWVSSGIVNSQSFDRLNLCAPNSLTSEIVQSNFGLTKMHWGSFQHWIFTFFPSSFQISYAMYIPAPT